MEGNISVLLKDVLKRPNNEPRELDFNKTNLNSPPTKPRTTALTNHNRLLYHLFGLESRSPNPWQHNLRCHAVHRRIQQLPLLCIEVKSPASVRNPAIVACSWDPTLNSTPLPPKIRAPA